MPIGLGASLGIGGGRSSTSSGAPSGGGGFSNEYSVDFALDYLEFTPSDDIELYGLSMWFSCTTAIDDSAIKGVLFGPSGLLWFLGMGGNFTSYLADEVISININTRYGYGSTSHTIATGWHHVVAAWSTSSATNSGADGYDIYLDGVKVGNIFDTRGAIAPTPALYTLSGGTACRIGQRANGGFPFLGLIDEVAIFDSTISSSDVTTLYNSGTPGSLSTFAPAGWWRMGDNNAASAGSNVALITDMGGGGNDATQSSASYQPELSTDVPS